MDILRNSQNPSAMMETMLSQNPNYNYVKGLIQQNGGDAKAAFFNLAKEKGVDPNTIINMLK